MDVRHADATKHYEICRWRFQLTLDSCTVMHHSSTEHIFPDTLTRAHSGMFNKAIVWLSCCSLLSNVTRMGHFTVLQGKNQCSKLASLFGSVTTSVFAFCTPSMLQYWLYRLLFFTNLTNTLMHALSQSIWKEESSIYESLKSCLLQATFQKGYSAD